MALGRHTLFLPICLEETYIIIHHQYMEFIDSLHSSLVITQLITETYLGFTDIECTPLQGILFLKYMRVFYRQSSAVRFQDNGYLAAKTLNVH